MSKIFALFIGILFICAFIRGISYLDPDFGWHYQMGKVITTSGIPTSDPFSYTMPSYHFIDHEWLSNVVIYFLYNFGGKYILSLTYGLIFVVALIIAIPKKFLKYAFIPVILSGLVILPFEGVRTQVVSWFFLAILLKFIFDESIWNRFKYTLPLLFIFWVNFHGSFALGIFLLMVFVVVGLIKTRKFDKSFLTLALSILATFVNPYGGRIWHEIYMQLTDTALSGRIGEWQRSFYYPDLAFCLLVALSSVLFIRFWKKFTIFEVSIFITISTLAVSGVRHIPLLAICAIYINSKAFYFLGTQINENKYNRENFRKIKKYLLIIFILFFTLEALITFWGTSLKEDKFYPKDMVSYLGKQNIKGEIFAGYNFGGYFIWKLPEKRVFIDGRMPSWRRNNAPKDESNDAFADMIKMDKPKFLKDTIFKYNIEYFIVPQGKQKRNYVIDFLENLLGQKTDTKEDTAANLKSLGFKKVYQDKIGAVYKRSLD